LEGFFNETTQVIKGGYINDEKVYDLEGKFVDYVDLDSYDADTGTLIRHYEDDEIFDRKDVFIGLIGENDTIIRNNVAYTRDDLFYDKNANFIGFDGGNNTIISSDNVIYSLGDIIYDENNDFIGFKNNELELNIGLTKEESSSSINDDQYQIDHLEEVKLTNIDNNSFDEILNKLSNDEMNFLNNSKRSYTQDQLAERVVEY
jgi:hypothetical protein